MEKTTVYLTSEQKVALARAAKAEGTSEARLIRAGVDAVIRPRKAAEARPALVRDAGDLPPQEPSSKVPAPAQRPRWMGRDPFIRLVLRHQADAGLRTELRELAPGTTDDEPLA